MEKELLIIPANSVVTIRKGGDTLCYLTKIQSLAFNCVLHLRVMRRKDVECPL